MPDLTFTIDREEFATAAAWVGRAVSSRPVNPLLGGVLITAAETIGVDFSAFDFETSAQVAAQADVAAHGRVLVSGRLLQSISKALPRKPVEVRAEGTSLRVSSGAAEFTLPTMNVGDYPELPVVPAATGVVASDVFAEAVAQTGFAAYKGEGREAIRGTICLEVDGDALTLVATDGFRAAARTIPWTPADATAGRHVVPARVLAEAARFGDATIQLALGDLIGVSCETRRTTTRGIAEEFPNWSRLLPAGHTTVVSVVVAEMADALGRVLAVDDRDFPHVRLDIGPGEIRMAGTHDEVGGIRDTVQLCGYYGDQLNLAVNARYLLEALTATHTDTATIGLTAPDKPMLIVPGAAAIDYLVPDRLEGDYLHLLMPVKGGR